MKNATKAALLSMSVGLVIWGCALPEAGRGPEAQTPAPKGAAPGAVPAQTPVAVAPAVVTPVAPLAPSQATRDPSGPRVMIPLPVKQAGTPPVKTPQGTPTVPSPGDSDNVRMQKLLGVTKLRQGVNGNGNAAYDEAAADPFTTVPDPLSMNDGSKVTDAKTWVEKRRPEIVEDFDREVYGRVPRETPKVTWSVSNTTNNGTTITKTLVGHVDNAMDPAINVNIQVTLVTPANATGPVPVMMQFGGGFGGGGAPGGGRGGAPGGAPGRGGPGGGAPRGGGAGGPPAGAMTPLELPLTAQMEDPFETFFTAAGGAAPGAGAGRGFGGGAGGAGAGRGAGGAPGGRGPGGAGGAGGAGGGGAWTAQLLAKGWGYATINTASIQADSAAGVTAGIIGLCNKGQPRKLDDWGVLRAWAWGASRALDYFETDKAVDAKKVGLEGHSRWGKATIIAMAYDERFAICYCSSSGEGGAKLHRRYWGEQVENVAGAGESYWMAGNFVKYAGPLNAGDLPVDSHELIAMCAPRPVLVTAGTQPAGDGWVDAKGTFLAALEAGPVYKLLGKKDMGSAGADGKHISATEMPPVETTLTDGDLAFRQHNGGHTDALNWPAFIEFAGRQFKIMDAKSK